MSGVFDRPVRYLITPGSITPANFHSDKEYLLETIRLAVETGIEIVQLREKSLSGRDLFGLASEAARIVRDSGTRLLVNERFDVAIAAGADGVHLTSKSIPVEQVRLNVPDGFLVGVSAHSQAEVEAAGAQNADFAMFGPVFATPGKGQPRGLDELHTICSAVEPFPVVAIGGIDASNFRDVINAGASGFAAIRYLNEFVRIAR